MTYLLIGKQVTSLINKTGENIYVRNYPAAYSARPSIIGKSKYDDYVASIDKLGKIHLVYKDTSNRILYVSEDNLRITLLEDNDDSYKLCNFTLLALEKKYLFYSAFNPFENTADLVFHIFDSDEDSSPQSLFTLQNLHSKYSVIYNHHTLYLLTTNIIDANYELNLYKYNINENSWEGYDNLVVSACAISEFSFCIDKETVHIVYVTEKYGHHSLNYIQFNGQIVIQQALLSQGQKLIPKIFIYNQIIWINYLSDNQLFTAFSVNMGHIFRSFFRSTIQGNSIIAYKLESYKPLPICGNEFYGIIDQYPKIATLSQIDVDNILFYSEKNDEIKEVFKTIISEDSKETINNNALQEELDALRLNQEEFTEKYNELVKFTKEVQDEGKKWRKKYQKATRELSIVKEEKEQLIRKEQLNKKEIHVEDKITKKVEKEKIQELDEPNIIENNETENNIEENESITVKKPKGSNAIIINNVDSNSSKNKA